MEFEGLGLQGRMLRIVEEVVWLVFLLNLFLKVVLAKSDGRFESINGLIRPIALFI